MSYTKYNHAWHRLHQSMSDHWRNEEVLWANAIQHQVKCTRNEAMVIAARIVARHRVNEHTRMGHQDDRS